MKDSSSDFANSFAYVRITHFSGSTVEQKDEQFVKKLTGDFRSMASDTVDKEVAFMRLIDPRIFLLSRRVFFLRTEATFCFVSFVTARRLTRRSTSPERLPPKK